MCSYIIYVISYYSIEYKIKLTVVLVESQIDLIHIRTIFVIKSFCLIHNIKIFENMKLWVGGAINIGGRVPKS